MTDDSPQANPHDRDFFVALMWFIILVVGTGAFLLILTWTIDAANEVTPLVI